MTLDMKLKAEQAKQLLQSKAFKEAIERVKNQQIQTFLSSSQQDVEMREKAHAIVLALSSIEHELTTAIADYEMLNRKKKREAKDSYLTAQKVVKDYRERQKSHSAFKRKLNNQNKNLNHFNGEPGHFNDVGSFDNKIITSNLENFKLALKIDVDGNEASVVKSLSSIIKESKPLILIEINKILLSKKELDYLISFFEENNYKILLST